MDRLLNLVNPGAEQAAADSDSGSQRKRRRDSLFLSAQIRIDGVEQPKPVRVRNLSEGGLMADLPNGAPIGAIVELDLRGIGRVVGQVAWCTAGRIGVAFDLPIDPQKARKPVGKTIPDDDWRKPMSVR